MKEETFKIRINNNEMPERMTMAEAIDTARSIVLRNGTTVCLYALNNKKGYSLLGTYCSDPDGDTRAYSFRDRAGIVRGEFVEVVRATPASLKRYY